MAFFKPTECLSNMKESTKQFLDTGVLCGVAIGASRDFVIQIFGAPIHPNLTCDGDIPSSESYPGLMFWYQNSKLVSMGVNFEREWYHQQGDSIIEWDSMCPHDDNVSVADYLNILKVNGVTYREATQAEKNDFNSIAVTPGGVHIAARRKLIEAPAESEALYEFTNQAFVVGFHVGSNLAPSYKYVSTNGQDKPAAFGSHQTNASLLHGPPTSRP
jgi:hypothetical protein